MKLKSKFPILGILHLRSLVLYFAILNIKIRFKNTYLGFLWAGLEPLLYFIVLYIVFTSIRIRPREEFAIYLITGIMLYHIFSRGTTGGLSSLVGNIGILKSLNIKRELFPITSTVAIAILGLVDVGVFFGLMPFFQFIPSITIVLLPLIFILLLILILGISYLFSIINVYARDVQHLWTVIVHALIFVTPIFWYVDEVKIPILLQLHSINPLGQIIELAHKIVIFDQVPPLEDWLYTTLYVSVIFIIGFFVFRTYEKRITEEL